MDKNKHPVKAVSAEINPLRGKRKGAVLKEEVWYESDEVVAYNLAYINLKLCQVDNLKLCQVDHGRVLGYDNSHGYHHRHFMGSTEAVRFTTYTAHLKRFIKEVHELWRIEDEED